MIRLGISEIDNDAAIALFEDQECRFAVSEERLSRVKQHRGFPTLVIDEVLRRAGLSVSDIDEICIAKPEMTAETRAIFGELRKYNSFMDGASLPQAGADFVALNIYKRFRSTKLIWDLNRQIDSWLRERRFPKERVKRTYNHHFLHAASAYYGSGFEDALAVTCDGQGAGVTASVYRCEKGRFRRLHEVKWPHSLGVFYAACTKALGFKPNRHEGKITGLASYEPPSDEALAFCRKVARSHGETFTVQAMYGRYTELQKLCERNSRGQVAAAFQIVLEEVMRDFVQHWVRKSGMNHVVLAGGVFANVKLNQRVLQLPEVDKLFVFPGMSDCGLSWGVAAFESRHREPFEPKPIHDVYWGFDYSEAEMERALRDNYVPFERVDNVGESVGDLLVDGHIVWRYDGRMEFGPRALGNRTIMYHCKDATVNDWLNGALNRTEFMPFAPVTLNEEAERCYVDFEGARHSAKFMTVTFDCTPQMAEWAPAAVHVDNTARPQLIDAETNPDYYAIVRRYFERTGNPSVINTSYNMHEEPIVCTPSDAVRAYLHGKVGTLSMGPFVAKLYPTPHRQEQQAAA